MKIFVKALVLSGALAGVAQAAHAATARAGEWETVLNGARRSLICLSHDRTFDAATFAKMPTMPGAKCSTGDFHVIGPQVSMTMNCEIGGGHMTVHTVVTTTGSDAYTTRSQSHFEGGSMQMPDMDITQTGRRLGECKPGDRLSAY